MISTRGNGPPLVLIPGIQGRWEYMRRPSMRWRASFRVLTFSLCGERGVDRPLDPARGLRQLRRAGRDGARSTHGIERAIDLRRLVRRPDRGVRFAAHASGADSRAGPGVDAGPAGSCGRAIDSTCARRGCSVRCSSPSRRGGCGREMAAALPERRRALAVRRVGSCARCRARRCRCRGWPRARG